MTATTHPEFNKETEALRIAEYFPQSIRGKTILVTGVNRKGIGFATVQAFASQSPARLILTGRTESKVNECIEDLKIQWPTVDYRLLKLDLSNQKAVRTAASEVLSWADVPAIDIVVNNAGIMSIPERTLNEDGIELHFATNHIGHFLFTNLIMPKLLAAAKTNLKGATRVVNVTSGACEASGIRWSDINFDKKSNELPEEERGNFKILELFGNQDPLNKAYMPTEAYIQSKAANVLYSVGLTKRLYENHGILSLAVHPGVIETELSRYASKEQAEMIATQLRMGIFTYKSLGAGAATSLLAASDPSLGPSEIKDEKEGWGTYLKDCQISLDVHPRARSSEQADRLWSLSEELVNEKFSW